MSTPLPGSAADLLTELTELGIRLKADGERLRFRPRERVTAELAGRMKALKAELLIALLQQRAAEQRVAAQLAQLVPHRSRNGRMVWIHPGHRTWLDRQGLL